MTFHAFFHDHTEGCWAETEEGGDQSHGIKGLKHTVAQVSRCGPTELTETGWRERHTEAYAQTHTHLHHSGFELASLSRQN